MKINIKNLHISTFDFAAGSYGDPGNPSVPEEPEEPGVPDEPDEPNGPELGKSSAEPSCGCITREDPSDPD